MAGHHDRDDLRMADLQTLLAVRRRGSISAAARELDVTPSQVSKAITRLEQQLQINLLERSARGAVLSDACKVIVPHVEEIVAGWKRLRTVSPESLPEFTIAAPSYLILAFLPAIAETLRGARARGLEMPPALVRAYAAEHFFDVALTLGLEKLPRAWVNVCVGDLRKALFAAPAVVRRLGAQPVSAEVLRGIPFVSPVFNANGRLLPADDGCPLGRGDRTLGHEVETIGLALEVAARTGQLVFGPVIAALPAIERGALVEIRVRGWNVTEPLYVACDGDRVLQRVQKSILAVVRRALARATAM